MDDLFQHPLEPISVILNFPKEILVKADIDSPWHQTALTKKKIEFWWKLKEYKLYLHQMGRIRPPPRMF